MCVGHALTNVHFCLHACVTLNSDKGAWFDSIPKDDFTAWKHMDGGKRKHAHDVRGARLTHTHVSDVGTKEVALGVGECTAHCARIEGLCVLDML